MATVRIEQRSKKTLTLLIDFGVDKVTKKRKRDTIVLDTTDMKVAEAERLRILADLTEDKYKKTDKTTLSDYIDYWFTTTVAKELASKTIERYKQCANLRIKPWIGNIRLADLTRDDLYNFYKKIISTGNLSNKKTKKTIGNDTVVHHHRFIRRLLNHALYEDEIITRNVALKIKLPEVPDAPLIKEKIKVLTQEEIFILEKYICDDQYNNLISVALRTGMRREELLALRNNCIDFTNNTIEIREALIYTKEKGFEFKLTKNQKSRIIEVTDVVIKAIKDEQQKNKLNKERIGKDLYNDTGLVFCLEDGLHLHPDKISTWFPKVCTKCGITRITFHGLRHTHASHLLASGEEISYVSKRLGHSSIEITYNTYFHFIPLEKRESLKRLENRFRNM